VEQQWSGLLADGSGGCINLEAPNRLAFDASRLLLASNKGLRMTRKRAEYQTGRSAMICGSAYHPLPTA